MKINMKNCYQKTKTFKKILGLTGAIVAASAVGVGNAEGSSSGHKLTIRIIHPPFDASELEKKALQSSTNTATFNVWDGVLVYTINRDTTYSLDGKPAIAYTTIIGEINQMPVPQGVGHDSTGTFYVAPLNSAQSSASNRK